MGGLLDQKSQPIFFLKENGTELEVVTGQQHISQNPDFTSIIKVAPHIVGANMYVCVRTFASSCRKCRRSSIPVKTAWATAKIGAC